MIVLMLMIMPVFVVMLMFVWMRMIVSGSRMSLIVMIVLRAAVRLHRIIDSWV